MGDGSNLVDTTFIDNAAAAHLNAFDRLAPASPISGKAYFIAQDEPRPIRDIVNDLIGAAGLPPITKTIPAPIAYAAGSAAEWFYARFRPDGEPPMTRFLAEQLATAHWFDLTAARTELGYVPEVSFREGVDRLRESYA